MKTAASATLLVAASCMAFGCGDADAALQMYKCIVAGRTVYQQAACAADAEPASAAAITAARPASASAPAKAASNASRGASTTATGLRPGAAPASSVPARPR